MVRTDVTAAANATVAAAPIVEYNTDPRGLRAFLALTSDVGSRLTPFSGQRFFVGPNDWHGDTIPPQRYTGMAHLGTSRVVHGRSSRIGLEREANPTNAAAMAVFAERARRR